MVDDITDIEEGDVLRVRYRSTHDSHGDELTQTMEAEVVDARFGSICDEQFASLILRWERDRDDGPTASRRLTLRPPLAPTLETLQLTDNGRRWQRLNAVNKCEYERVVRGPPQI